MKNGEVKHSNDLTEEDLAGEKRMANLFNRPVPTLQQFREKPGHYIGFCPRKGGSVSLKGPFENPQVAKEAHREWMWESKHS
jgi:hypothetical protein